MLENNFENLEHENSDLYEIKLIMFQVISLLFSSHNTIYDRNELNLAFS
jgi:hypothetical protein